MDAVKNTIQNVLTWILNLLYPGVAFDTAGLAGIMTSCLIVLAAAVLVYLLLKCFPDIRKFAHVAVVAAVTVLIAVSAFFPKTLVQAGDYAGSWLEQHYWAQEEKAPEEGAPPTEEAPKEEEAPEEENAAGGEHVSYTVYVPPKTK